MKLRAIGQTEVTIVVCCAITALLFLRSAAVDPVERNHVETRLIELGRNDALLDQELLRVRLGLVEHYDGIVDQIGELARMRAELVRPPSFLSGGSRARYIEQFERYQAAALQKEAIAEHFKSTNAALRNSLVYFPIVTRAVLDSSPSAEHAGRLRRLFEAMLQYEANGSYRDRVLAEAAMAEVEAAAAANPTFAEKTEPIRAHGRNILERRPALDATIQRLVDNPTPQLIAELGEGFRDAAEFAQRRANGYRVMLYLCGVCLIGAMAFSFQALRRAKLGLEEMNRDLDRRVHERTLDLETTNCELEQSQEALEKSKREQLELRDRFLSHVSHELRTPLAAIHQFLELLLDGVAGNLAAEQKNFAQLAYKNARQLEAMVRDLMDITRAESGKLEVEARPLQLPILIEESIAAFSRKASELKIEIELQVDELLPQALADATRVRQIIYNLVENAIKFTPEGGRIRVKADRASEPGFIDVAIEDTGRGIDSESLERVFDRLHQVSREDSRARAGLGLGLAISRELVHRQGGRIWVESEVGSGSTFHFTLPIYSLCEIVRPTVAPDGQLRSEFSLLRVEVQVPGSTAGHLLPSTRRELTDRLRLIAYYPMDVLVSSDQDDVIFVVAATGDAGSRALSERISAHLTGSDPLSALDVNVRAVVEHIEESDRARALEEALPPIADRIADRMRDPGAWAT